MTSRMEELVARGIQIQMQTGGPAPVVMIKVSRPEDAALVPEITWLTHRLHQALLAAESSNGEGTPDQNYPRLPP